MTTILLAGGGTGGHLMPALAIARAVRAGHPEWKCVFAGAERGVEAKILPERGETHYLLPLEPIYRRTVWRNLRWPFRLLGLIRQVDRVLDAVEPDMVIGTGGYVSGPVVWRAARRGLPTAILELDVRPGLATSLLAKGAREIWVAAPETVPALPSSARARAVVTGAPIEAPDPSRRDAARRRFGIAGREQVVVVTGGSQGALAINRVTAEWVRSGSAKGATLIWMTGSGTYAEFAALHAPPYVHVIPFLDPMADAWAVADLCVARAGMMTIAELCAWGIPSLLIPLPTAAADHQTHNALALQAAGAAQVMLQDALTPNAFASAVAALLRNPQHLSTMQSAARLRGRPAAAATIADRVVELIGPLR